MKKFIAAFVALFIGGVAFAATTTLQHYQAGPRLINGSKLNLMVDTVNALNSGLATFSGEIALDGSNPTAVTTGLSSISGCNVSLKVSTAPGVGTSVVTYSTSSGTLNIYGWKVTSSADNTLIASTGTETVGWTCVGTK